MARRHRYGASARAKLAATVLVVLIGLTAWQSGALDAIGALFVLPVPGSAQG